MVKRKELEYPLSSCNCPVQTNNYIYHDKKCPIFLYGALMEALEERETNFVVRKNVTDKDIDKTVEAVKNAIHRRLRKHGFGLAASLHEVLGILVEEMNEFEDEVKANDTDKAYYELQDIAVAAIFGMISMEKLHKFEDHKKRGWL